MPKFQRNKPFGHQNREDLIDEVSAKPGGYPTPNNAVKKSQTQVHPPQQYNILDFSGGMQVDSPGVSIGANEFEDVYNFLIDDKSNLKCRDPYKILNISGGANYFGETIRMVADGRGGSERILLAYITSSSETQIVESWSGSALTPIKDGNVTSLALFDSIIEEIEFITFGDRVSGLLVNREILIFAKGKIPIRYNTALYTTSYIKNMGLTAPDASNALDVEITTTAAKAGFSGLEASGTYYYKCSYIYDAADSSLFGESQAVEMGNDGDGVEYVVDGDTGEYTEVNLTTFASLAGVDGVIKLRVYRSPPNNKDGPYRLVLEIEDDSLAIVSPNHTVSDQTPWSQLAETYPMLAGSNIVPLNYPKQILDRICAFEYRNPNKFVWSGAGQPDVFPAPNFANLEDAGTAIEQFNSNIYLWTKNHIYVIKDSNFDNPPLKISDVGCVSHKTVINVETGIMWLGPENVYWANFNQYSKNGQLPHPVANQIQSRVRKLDPSYDYKACATAYDGHYYVSFAESGPNNDVTYAMNLKTGGWSRMDFIASDMNTNNDKFYTTSKRRDTYSSDTEHIFTHGEDKTQTRDQRNTELDSEGNFIEFDIYSSIKTGPLHFGHEASDSIVKSISIVADAVDTLSRIDVQFPDTGASYTKGNLNLLEEGQHYPLGKTQVINKDQFLIWADDGDDTAANVGSIWAANSVDDEKPFWFYVNSVTAQQHFKIETGVKGGMPQITTTFSNAGQLRLVALSIYYVKMMPPA